MPRPKKASSKKSSAKTVAKRSQKKPVKKLAQKAVKTVAKTKKHAEDALLNQHFIESLANLEKFWSKKAVTLKKQLGSLQAKHDKASTKGAKTAKSELARKKRQEEIAGIKQDLANAKLSLSKFNMLSKTIEQFERDWLKKLADDAKAKAEPKPQKNKSTKTDKQSEKIVKSKVSQTVMPDFEPTAKAIEPVEEEMDDLEDIFMPQDDVSEFEVIEDFSVAEEDDLYDDYNN